MKDGKTKSINGVSCGAACFAYIEDEQNTATWLLPLWIPGDAKKTLNALKTSLHRFDSAKIPDCEKQRVFDTVRGALLSHGIDVERRAFAAKSNAPTPAAEPPPPPRPLPEVKTKPVKKDPMIEAVIADADRRATELLRSLGLE